MNQAPYWNILPSAQQRLWARLEGLPEHFVLYGGTALALQLGHRSSVDFDFFSSRPLVPRQLREQLDFLAGSKITQEERNTLTVQVGTEDGPVSVSFFGGLKLRTVKSPLEFAPGVRIADVCDVFGCKCATIQKRRSSKDLADICAVLRQTGLSLPKGLGFAKTIYGEQFNPYITLRMLSYPPALEGLSPADRRQLEKAVESVDVGNIPCPAPRGLIGLVAPVMPNAHPDTDPPPCLIPTPD